MLGGVGGVGGLKKATGSHKEVEGTVFIIIIFFSFNATPKGHDF